MAFYPYQRRYPRSAVRRTFGGRGYLPYNKRPPMKMIQTKKYPSRLSTKKVFNNTVSVKGYKGRLSTATELKWTQVTWPNTFAIAGVATNGTIIWCNTKQWGAGPYVPMITTPQSGTSQNQFEGSQINSLYCDVRFWGGLDYNIMAAGIVRVYVAKMRTPAPNTGDYQYSLPWQTTDPIDTKIWDVFYDQCFPLVAQNGTQTPPKFWRFIIPFKATITFKQGVALWPYPIVIGACCSRDQGYVIQQVTCKFFYKDP